MSVDVLETVNRLRRERATVIKASMDQFEARQRDGDVGWEETWAKCEEWQAAIDDANRIGARVAAVVAAPRPELPPKLEAPEARIRPKAYFRPVRL